MRRFLVVVFAALAALLVCADTLGWVMSDAQAEHAREPTDEDQDGVPSDLAVDDDDVDEVTADPKGHVALALTAPSYGERLFRREAVPPEIHIAREPRPPRA